VKDHIKLFLFLLAASLVLSLSAPVQAGLARDYLNVPVGSWYPAYYCTASQTNLSALDTQISTTTNIFRVSHVNDLNGRCGGFDLLVPFASTTMTNRLGLNYQRAGMGDLMLLAEMNIYGAPAYSKEDFKKYTPQNFASLHLRATLPTGDYNPSNPTNIGTNRFSVTPIVNFSFTPSVGEDWWELYVMPTFYTDNCNYAGGTRLSQNPELNLEGHASHTFFPWLWAALDMYYTCGGETAINGAWQNNANNVLSIGATANFTIWHDGWILFSYNQPLNAPANAAQTRVFTLNIAQLIN